MLNNIFGKEKKSNIKIKDDMNTIRFYFVSGIHMDVKYTKEKFEEISNMLLKNWNQCNSACESFGINFSLVTHYELV